MTKSDRLCVVTATTNAEKARACIESWGEVPTFCQHNGGEKPYAGVVPAFCAGVDAALEKDYDIIACLHDDVEIHDPHWIRRVVEAFDSNPKIGLLGFGGAIGVGADDLYEGEYIPTKLARIGFRSNLVDAEKHGMRSLRRERVACLDGFSLIGRQEFFLGPLPATFREPTQDPPEVQYRPWHVLRDLGMIHHAYDGALGCLAARYGWETWYLPIACTHYGGRTAVGDPGYQAWAKTQTPDGDRGFWEAAHWAWYDNFKDVLPLRV